MISAIYLNFPIRNPDLILWLESTGGKHEAVRCLNSRGTKSLKGNYFHSMFSSELSAEFVIKDMKPAETDIFGILINLLLKQAGVYISSV